MIARFFIGFLITIEIIICGGTWLMGYDLTIKEKAKIIIGMNAFVGVLFFGFCLIL